MFNNVLSDSRLINSAMNFLFDLDRDTNEGKWLEITILAATVTMAPERAS
jgi:hypothetical protein